jgi:hypothetical protein
MGGMVVIHLVQTDDNSSHRYPALRVTGSVRRAKLTIHRSIRVAERTGVWSGAAACAAMSAVVRSRRVRIGPFHPQRQVAAHQDTGLGPMGGTAVSFGTWAGSLIAIPW